jgi:hypothetical protein
MEAGMTAGMSDRRHGRRFGRPEEHGIVSARIRPGYDVEVVDVSTGGVLVESSHRLMPGATVELQLQSESRGAQIVRGQVLRCCVAHLGASGVSYQGAIAFEHYRWRFSEDSASGYAIPGPEIEGFDVSG